MKSPMREAWENHPGVGVAVAMTFLLALAVLARPAGMERVVAALGAALFVIICWGLVIHSAAESARAIARRREAEHEAEGGTEQ